MFEEEDDDMEAPENIEHPYDILKNMYKAPSHRAHEPQAKMHDLGKIKAIQSFFHKKDSVELDRFTLENANDFNRDPETTNHRLNVYYYPKSLDSSKKTVIFCAHYDVANLESDNVLDNTASVANVIAIGKKTAYIDLPVNVVVALTDAEELVSFSSAGSKRLANRINAGKFGDIIEVINFELTAYGNVKWANGSGRIAQNKEFKVVDTPYNDASVLMRNGIPATCIGLFTQEDADEVDKRGYCKNWMYCHSPDDKFELANRDDMNAFAEWFVNYLKEK